jgi:hypothetical protein
MDDCEKDYVCINALQEWRKKDGWSLSLTIKQHHDLTIP